VYRSLLHLSWVDKLVDNIRTLFVDLYGDQLKKPHTTLLECDKFDEYFDQQMKELEKSSLKADSKTTEAYLPLEDELISGNLGDEPPLPPGLVYRGWY
jgi:signal recognition particle receptor subunit alpha